MKDVSKVFTERKVFDNISFYLQQDEKVGVIGINGTGKSTLLRMIAGLEEADSGEIITSNNLVIRYLPQNPDFPEDATVIQAVLNSHLKSTDLSTGKTDHDALDSDYWTLESDARSMLTKLGVYDFDRPVSELSGGQRKRLALVSVLLYPSDILVLDEPTNHLDQEMAEWLENVLKSRKGALVMVTHDRYFLDSIADRIIEIDKGIIYSYDSGYSGYLELKMQRLQQMVSAEEKRQNILRKELAWIRRGARARSTKQKAHIQRYEALRDQASPEFDRQVQLDSISTRMGKTTVELNNISKAYGDNVIISDFTYNFLKTDRIGFVGANGAGKTTLLKMITGLVKPDSGSITIGQTIRIGYFSQEIDTDPETGISYMDPDELVIDYIKDTAEYIQTSEGRITATRMLERFLFTPSMQYTRIGKLSGGEKRRLNLLKVLMEAPNVLLLDEPTNDLDITTLNILEDYLDSFEGIVAAVSHDRYFLDRVVNRIFELEGNGRVNQYEGGWTDYRNKKAASDRGSSGSYTGGRNISGLSKESSGPAVSGFSAPIRNVSGFSKDSSAPSSGSSSTAFRNSPCSSTDSPAAAVSGSSACSTSADSRDKPQKQKKFTFKEQRDYETIEAEIEELEDRISSLEDAIAANSSDFMKLTELNREKDDAEALLLEKMERWEYLEELARSFD
ncbi:MAG: ABC-F family ATP-binding cassette domain-containing protein [Parasporobacterium sp.]|nr:ABC-F family ATP-binding cassette domain-containing protein [Parasporobacterium sp.]